MFTYPKFDVEVATKIDATALRWPKSGEATDDSGLGCNRLYADLRFLSFAEAERTFALEGDLISRIETAEDPEAECDLINEELYEGDEDLFGLDLGVAAAVVSLSATGCIPFSSCNAGSFGGHHQEVYPLVAFFVGAQVVDLIVEAARERGGGLENGPDGCVIAYADDIREMRAFAAALLSRRHSFDALRARKNKQRSGRASEQLELGLCTD